MGILQTGWYGVVLGVVGTYDCRLVGAPEGGEIWYVFIIIFGILFLIISLRAVSKGGGIYALLAKNMEW